jgi:hypothetical protein
MAARFMVLCVALLALGVAQADPINIYSNSTCAQDTFVASVKNNMQGQCSAGPDGRYYLGACVNGSPIVNIFPDSSCSSSNVLASATGAENACVAVQPMSAAPPSQWMTISCNSASTKAASASLMIALIAVVSMVFFA